MGCTLMILTFAICLVYPPAAAVVVPLFIVIWIIHYLSKESRKSGY